MRVRTRGDVFILGNRQKAENKGQEGLAGLGLEMLQ